MSDHYHAARSTALAQGDRGFCVPLAYSVVTGLDFNDVNSQMIKAGIRRKGKGSYQKDWEPFGRKQLGLNMVDITADVLDQARTVKTAARILRKGRYLVRVRGHLLALVDGVVHDWTEGRQHRVKQVFKIVDNTAPVAPVAPIAPVAPVLKPTKPAKPTAPKGDIMRAATALRERLLNDHGFQSFELGFSGKFVKYNTRQGTVYLSSNKNQVRFFVRNEDTVRALSPIMQDFGYGAGTITAKYTFWMLDIINLENLRRAL